MTSSIQRVSAYVGRGTQLATVLERTKGDADGGGCGGWGGQRCSDSVVHVRCNHVLSPVITDCRDPPIVELARGTLRVSVACRAIWTFKTNGGRERVRCRHHSNGADVSSSRGSCQLKSSRTKGWRCAQQLDTTQPLMAHYPHYESPRTDSPCVTHSQGGWVVGGWV